MDDGSLFLASQGKKKKDCSENFWGRSFFLKMGGVLV
jgi:hypothetical protein